MRFRLLLAIALVTLSVATACYQTDAVGPLNSKGVTRVLLTDAPFPFDSVTHVNVYVVRVDATTNPDTTVQDSGWVTVAAPHKVFDLLALQQGTTTIVGSGELSAGAYKALRVVINADSSSIVWSGNIPAAVDWQEWNGPEVPLYALVESPVAVPQEGADIVIDFDVGRSFLYDYFGVKEFVLTPWLRAVNAAATGAVAGTVTSNLYGPTQPLQNVNVTVYQGDSLQSFATWTTVATGHTDAQGHYRIAYLRPGTYTVRFEEPIIPALRPATRTSVTVTRGGTTSLPVFLATSTAGSAGVHVSGAASIGVGGGGRFSAWVLDSAGNPVASAVVTWAVSDTSIAAIGGDSSYAGGSAAFLVGKQPGWLTLTATSGASADSLLVQVVGQPAPVASVSLTPSDTTLAVGDSVEFRAMLRDSAGVEIAGDVAVSWSISDSTVVRLTWSSGRYALVQPVGPGTAVLQALVQGKAGRSALTVH
jgi:hypothetical protein